jgi:hypothetical protein
VRGFVLRYDDFHKDADGGPKVQRELVCEDVVAETAEEAIQEARKILAGKWKLVTETGVKYYNKEKVEVPGYVFEAS